MLAQVRERGQGAPPLPVAELKNDSMAVLAKQSQDQTGYPEVLLVGVAQKVEVGLEPS